MSKVVIYGNELYHHGILGQKWGQRRWQNEDGSLTPEGREHYGYGESRSKVYDAKNNLKNAKRELKKTKSYQTQRDFKYGDFSRFTKEGRRVSAEIKEQKQAVKNARTEYKQIKQQADKQAVKNWHKALETSGVNKLSDAVDNAFDNMINAENQYGKNSKEYKIAKEKLDNLDKELDNAWKDKDLQQAYLDTGANYIERIYNNIKYYKM